MSVRLLMTAIVMKNASWLMHFFCSNGFATSHRSCSGLQKLVGMSIFAQRERTYMHCTSIGTVVEIAKQIDTIMRIKLNPLLNFDGNKRRYVRHIEILVIAAVGPNMV